MNKTKLASDIERLALEIEAGFTPEDERARARILGRLINTATHHSEQALEKIQKGDVARARSDYNTILDAIQTYLTLK